MSEANEEKMVELACNALTVAGQEMGEGDHWPVIHSTIANIKDDWEQLQIERDVFEEVRKHYEETLRELEVLHAETPEELKSEVRAGINALREIYDAMFIPAGPYDMYINAAELPMHIKRAEAIIKTLGVDDDEAAA